MFTVFKKTRELISKIDEFLDTLLMAGLEFREGLKYYIDGKLKEFEDKTKKVDQLEGKADALRREIENIIYSHMLIPEARGDVLALLENSDDVLNIISDTMVEFYIEKPLLPEEIKKDFENLVDVSINAVEEMVMAVRSYFKELYAVRDHIAKIMFYEKESDKIGQKIKEYLFNNQKIELCHKIHLRTFVNYIQTIADQAEDIGDRVSIYAIKRMV